MTDEQQIQTLSLEEEMKSSYLTYAMSVIIQRALPDVRDGLKPSQRRILVAMNDLNLGPRSKHRKCAKVAGDTSGNYHPHGESVIYPTLVRMAQPFNMRHMLVDGQGNFGSVDGDPAAAMRYTEARLSRVAGEIMADLGRDTVAPGAFAASLARRARRRAAAVGVGANHSCHAGSMPRRIAPTPLHAPFK